MGMLSGQDLNLIFGRRNHRAPSQLPLLQLSDAINFGYRMCQRVPTQFPVFTPPPNLPVTLSGLPSPHVILR
jgi:hypothetical protein